MPTTVFIPFVHEGRFRLRPYRDSMQWQLAVGSSGKSMFKFQSFSAKSYYP
jgi:hypothetical protein